MASKAPPKKKASKKKASSSPTPKDLEVKKAEIVERSCKRVLCNNTTTTKYCCKDCQVLDMKNGVVHRKTDYKKSYADKHLRMYLEECIQGNNPTLIPTKAGYLMLPNAKLPSVTGYANFLGYEERTLYRWAKKHPEFDVALKAIKQHQKEMLMNGGLSGRYNAPVTKMILSFNHGMIERKAIDTTNKYIGIVKHVYEEAERIRNGEAEPLMLEEEYD